MGVDLLLKRKCVHCHLLKKVWAVTESFIRRRLIKITLFYIPDCKCIKDIRTDKTVFP